MLIWEENAHKCNENSVAMQKHLLKTGQMPYWWDLTAFVWKSILLCFLQDTAVIALLQKTSPMIPSVWTTAGVWRESASRSVKLWRTCSRVLAMVSWPADNANTDFYMAVTVFRVCLEQTWTFYFSETNSSCKVCCRYKNAVCAPYVSDKGNHLYLRKGKPCTVGFCDGEVWANVQLQLWKNIYKSCLYSPINYSIHKTIRNACIQLFKHFLLFPGQMHETGSGCYWEVVGFHWEVGHQYFW